MTTAAPLKLHAAPQTTTDGDATPILPTGETSIRTTGDHPATEMSALPTLGLVVVVFLVIFGLIAILRRGGWMKGGIRLGPLAVDMELGETKKVRRKK